MILIWIVSAYFGILIGLQIAIVFLERKKVRLMQRQVHLKQLQINIEEGSVPCEYIKSGKNEFFLPSTDVDNASKLRRIKFTNPNNMYRFSPQYIIFYCMDAYMSDDIKEMFKKQVGRSKAAEMRESTFIKIITSYVDISRLKDKPYSLQDIWVYDYIIYPKLPRHRSLLHRYEKEIIQPSEAAFKKLMKEIE